ncbi:hypothetical protein ACP4OV_022076 [Aristida adscensionis]
MGHSMRALSPPQQARSLCQEPKTWPYPAPLSMKLLVDTKARRALYAEAGKDAAGFLFSLLALPADGGDDLFAGSVGNLYRRAKKLDGAGAAMSPPAAGGGRLVRHAVAPPSAPAAAVLVVDRYTVTDDLRVAPMSAIPCVALLDTLRVIEMGALEEKTVQLGPAVVTTTNTCSMPQRRIILKASLQSKTVLTDVFLGKKKASKLRRELSLSRRDVAVLLCYVFVLLCVMLLAA